MLYTIVPFSALFPEETPEGEYHTVGKVIVEYRRLPDGSSAARRMITSDLREYLPR